MCAFCAFENPFITKSTLSICGLLTVMLTLEKCRFELQLVGEKNPCVSVACAVQACDVQGSTVYN